MHANQDAKAPSASFAGKTQGLALPLGGREFASNFFSLLPVTCLGKQK